MITKLYVARAGYKSVLLFQGKIACANVLSDLYAMGVTDCDNMLMLLGVSTKMSEKERDVVVPMMMRGFKVSYLSAKMARFATRIDWRNVYNSPHRIQFIITR